MINNAEQTLFRLNTLDIQQQKVNYQMSTRKKLQNGSDDSILYAKQVLVEDKLRVHEHLKAQLEMTVSQNNSSDSTVSRVKDVLSTLKAEMIKANTSTSDGKSKKIIASSIEGMKENLFQLVNTKIEDEYLFSGSDSSIKAFEKDSTGKIVYKGDSKLREIAVDDNGLYKGRGINGLDLMFYASSTAYKGETLTFSSEDRIFDEDGNEWKLNEPTNDTLTKLDYAGNLTADTLSVTSNGATPPKFSATVPNSDGIKFEAKSNIFNILDNIVNALKQVDSSGNPISMSDAKQLVSQGVNDVSNIYNSVNDAHSKLGANNKAFEVSFDNISAKYTQYNVLYEEISAADLKELAIQSKSLELTYTALYSTINRTNQLSLVNFLK